jgi:hypothetical protein
MTPLHAGCPGPGPGMPLTILESRQHSGITGTGPQFVVVSDREHFADVFKKIHSKAFSLPELPSVDFERQIVVAAFWGQKPTGGYNISFEKTAYVENETLRVSVIMQSPSEGVFLPQVMTSPYVLAATERGKYDHVAFADKDGNILNILEMPGTN